jgi:hypothetical protein
MIYSMPTQSVLAAVFICHCMEAGATDSRVMTLYPGKRNGLTMMVVGKHGSMTCKEGTT